MSKKQGSMWPFPLPKIKIEMCFYPKLVTTKNLTPRCRLTFTFLYKIDGTVLINRRALKEIGLKGGERLLKG